MNFLLEFDYGDDAVLLTMDGAGSTRSEPTLSEAIPHGSSQLDHDGVTHLIQIQTGAADIDLQQTRVVWILDAAKAHGINHRASPW